MKVSLTGFIFFVCLFAFDANHKASASCTADQNGTLTLQRTAGQQMTAVCKTDIEEQISSVAQVGVCADFPLQANMVSLAGSLSQCQNMLSAPIDVNISIGGSQIVEALSPASGTYPYFYQLVSARTQFKALFHFADPIVGGNGQNPSQAETGTWCSPPPFEYSTSTIFDGILPSKCQNTEPTSVAFSTMHFNNVGFLEWAGLLSVPAPDTAPDGNSYVVDETAFQHVILLDAQLNIISDEDDKNDTEYVFILQKMDPMLDISAGSNLTLETTLTDKGRAPVGCSADISLPCAFNTPYRSVSLSLVLD